jgi:pyruvate,water dikinase
MVIGKIVIIKSPAKPLVVKFSNYILVASFTTPVLATVISNAKGIILECGGLAAHGAIIAREFNIPCLVAAKGALKLLKNDMHVMLDATKGKVYAVK